MNRAYALLNVKAIDDDERIIAGIASTPTPDRLGDIVDPMGIQYRNPLPLLHQHDAEKPVGTVTFKKPTKEGVEFVARLPRIEEPPSLKDRIDTAWAELKAGLVRGVSIGFRSLKHAFLDNGGIEYSSTEVLELSLVTIPANSEAVISTIKRFDRPLLASLGKEPDASDRPTPPGATGKSQPIILTPRRREEKNMKTFAEQIAALEAKRAATSARMAEIMQKGIDEGRTTTTEEQEEFDTLERDLAPIDADLKRFRALEKANQLTVRTVTGSSPETAGLERGGSGGGGGSSAAIAPLQVRRNLPEGVVFVRLLGAKYLAYKMQMSPIEVARNKFPDTPEVEAILRAAIAAGTTEGTTWAAPLVQLTDATEEFVAKLRPATIIGRIPGLTRVPFNIRVPRGTQDPTAYWVGQGSVKPVSDMAFDSIELDFHKVAGIVPMTEELLRFSRPGADTLVRDGLIAAIAYLTDRDFLDPTKAEVVGVSPASITNGVSAITPSGTSADALRDDLGRLIDAYLTLNMSVDGLVLVMTSGQAMKIGLMRSALSTPEFPGIGRNGGTLEGIPVITSQNIVAAGGSPADGFPIVAINAPEILLADDGGVDVDLSREASLQMSSTPDSPESASTVLVSLWQRNMVAIKAERFITWKKRQTGAVQYIQGAKYA